MDFFNKSEQAILLKAENIIVGFSGGADSTLALYATNEFLKSHDQTSKLMLFMLTIKRILIARHG